MHIETAPYPTNQPIQSTPMRSETDDTVVALGPVPPPVTGMTLLTSAVLNALQQAGNVQFFNWSPGMQRRTLRMRLKRNFRILRSLLQLIRKGRVRNQRLYLVANANSGLYATAALVLVSKRLGYTIYLHHHVYYYIDQYDWRMAWIVRQMDSHDMHVVHADKMIQDLRDRYATRSGFITIAPSIVVKRIGRAREQSHRPFRLGLLSNLSRAKGLDEAIETFVALAKRQRDVSLTLAGPVPNVGAKRVIENTIANYPGRVRHLGPVYEGNKDDFFSEIDAFLFPTKSESWGLVLNEALAAGVPVITFDRGCTAKVVGNHGAGLLIDPGLGFTQRAAVQIEQWMDNHQDYRDASSAAIAQAEYLACEASRSLYAFLSHMFSVKLPSH